MVVIRKNIGRQRVILSDMTCFASMILFPDQHHLLFGATIMTEKWKWKCQFSI